MFEAVNTMTPNIQGGSTVSSPQVVPPQTPEKTTDKTDHDNVVAMKQAARAKEKAAEGKRGKERPEVTEEMLKELEQDIESMHSVGLSFSKHNDTGRLMIKVMDKSNQQLIREIPSEDVLNLAAKMEEMIGLLFDKKV